jgi:L-fuconolactonase
MRMRSTDGPTSFGRSIQAPNEAWLAKQLAEPVLDPELPIIDTHHHFWDRPDHRYLLDEFLADINSGHNIVATVFPECRSMYHAQGPAETRAVGKTEFVAGLATMSASGAYGSARVAAGIVVTPL